MREPKNLISVYGLDVNCLGHNTVVRICCMIKSKYVSEIGGSQFSDKPTYNFVKICLL